MKSSEVLLIVLVVVLAFFCYELNKKVMAAERELERCRTHPIENAAEYYLE